MKKKVTLNPFTGMLQLLSYFSVRADGNTPISNPLTLISGTNVTLTQAGSTITISANGAPPPVLTGYVFQDSFNNPGPGSMSVFTLTNTPLNISQIIVKCDGVVLIPTAYTYNAGLNQVTITGGIAAGQSASFEYFSGLNSVLIKNEILSGTVNGTNPTFTLSTAPTDSSGVRVLIDGRTIQKSKYTILGTTITFNSGSIPAPGQFVHAVYQYSGTVLQSGLEVPIGIANGSNAVFGPVRFDPNEASAVIVMKDGIETTGYTLVGKSIMFTAGNEPSVGQDVSIYYFFVDLSGAEQAEYVTLTSDQVTSKSLQLEYTPRNPTEVLMDIRLQGALTYASDFIINGNTVSWSGLGFDGVATTGMKLRFYYFI